MKIYTIVISNLAKHKIFLRSIHKMADIISYKMFVNL